MIVVGLPELPLTLKRARIEPMLAPSASNDISGSFHRARLLFPILEVWIQEKSNNEINAIQSIEKLGKENNNNKKKSNKINLPFSLRFGLHRRHSSFDRYGNHEIAQRSRRYLGVGVELVVQSHVRLRRLALPIGHQVQRR